MKKLFFLFVFLFSCLSSFAWEVWFYNNANYNEVYAFTQVYIDGNYITLGTEYPGSKMDFIGNNMWYFKGEGEPEFIEFTNGFASSTIKFNFVENALYSYYSFFNFEYEGLMYDVVNYPEKLCRVYENHDMDAAKPIDELTFDKGYSEELDETFSVYEILPHGFEFNHDLIKIILGDKVAIIGGNSFLGCDHLSAIEFNNALASIGAGAFAECSALKSIELPTSLTTISDVAFYNSGLESVYIPESVDSIGNSSFGECKSLLTIEVDEKNLRYASQDGILYDKNMKELMQYPAGRRLASYVIPHGIEKICSQSFAGNLFIKNVEIPESVISIDGYAFNGCTSIESIICNAIVPPVCGSQCFWGVNASECDLYVPAECKEAYEETAPWNQFNIKGMNGFDSIYSLIEESAEKIQIYNLKGQRIINNSTNSLDLSPGLYIINGKKVMISK